jgi:hypothetical protein
MTLRLAPLDKHLPELAGGTDGSQHYVVMSGSVDIGRISSGPGGIGKWQWSIYRVITPGGPLSGSADGRDDAMVRLAARWRGLLDVMGLMEKPEE